MSSTAASACDMSWIASTSSLLVSLLHPVAKFHRDAARLLWYIASCFLASDPWPSVSGVARSIALVKHSSACSYSPFEKCLFPVSLNFLASFWLSVSRAVLLMTVLSALALSSSARMGSGASGCFCLQLQCIRGLRARAKKEEREQQRETPSLGRREREGDRGKT